MIRIYNVPAPTRALRPIWLCEEMGLAYEVSLLSFPPGEEYRARHPIGSVPFLEDEGGVAIGESVAMLIYLAERYGPTPLWPASDDPQFAQILSLTVFGEATLGAAIGPLLATHFRAPEGRKESWLREYLEQRCGALVDYASKKLGSGPFLAGERFTVADIAVSNSLGFWTGTLAKPIPDNLAAYQERLKSRPAFQRAFNRACGVQA